MPRAPTSHASRSRKTTTAGKAPPSPPLRHCCTKCEWSFPRKSDLARHSSSAHMSPEQQLALMHSCPIDGCSYKALQKSNLITHFNAKHSGLKPHTCSKCVYRAADPSCLNKHMRSIHGERAGTQKRKAKSEGLSAAFQQTLESTLSAYPVAARSYTDYPEQSTSSWTPCPAPLYSFDSSPSPASCSSSMFAEDQFATLPPVATLDEPFLFYGFSPSPSTSSESSTSTSPPLMWDAEFDNACHAMSAASGCVSPAQLHAPMLHLPAEGAPLLYNGAEFSDIAFALESVFNAPLLSPVPDNFLSYLPQLSFDPMDPLVNFDWTGVVY
ncbi:hypothetical protein C8R43DRAFT_1191804 [Mycena crocata]|nr:hypothetical protein C8R43DRAFT_1191804 [Mycena crocata]